jgi:hypothetical protein
MHKSGLIAAAITTAAALILPVAAGAQNRPAPASPARSAAPAAAPARPGTPQQSQIPQAASLIVLIKSSLIALNQANLTGNYQVLYALGSNTLRSTTNPQNLAQSFAAFRQRGVDLNPILYLNPQLTRPAAIEQGRLHIVGYFPTKPLQITFDFWFEPSQGQWKFVQLNTNLVPIAQAPAPGQPQRPQQPQPPQQQRR